jgi:hypothetical protein
MVLPEAWRKQVRDSAPPAPATRSIGSKIRRQGGSNFGTSGDFRRLSKRGLAPLAACAELLTRPAHIARAHDGEARIGEARRLWICQPSFFWPPRPPASALALASLFSSGLHSFTTTLARDCVASDVEITSRRLAPRASPLPGTWGEAVLAVAVKMGVATGAAVSSVPSPVHMLCDGNVIASLLYMSSAGYYSARAPGHRSSSQNTFWQKLSPPLLFLLALLRLLPSFPPRRIPSRPSQGLLRGGARSPGPPGRDGIAVICREKPLTAFYSPMR